MKIEQLAEAWEASAIAYAMSIDKPEVANGYGGALMDCARELRRAITPPQASEGALPDAFWEALQRLIENAAVQGPASMDDARLVGKYRDRLAAASRDAVPEGWKQLSVKPLTDDDIEAIASSVPALSKTGEPTWEHAIARAIERAHGISVARPGAQVADHG